MFGPLRDKGAGEVVGVGKTVRVGITLPKMMRARHMFKHL